MADNNKKDSFEEFFQKKTGEYDIPFREEDWLKLEKKLDVRDVQNAYRKKIRWIAAAAILIVSLLGYFTYENHNRLNQISQQLSDEIVETDPDRVPGQLPVEGESQPDIESEREELNTEKEQPPSLTNLRDQITPVPDAEEIPDDREVSDTNLVFADDISLIDTSENIFPDTRITIAQKTVPSFPIAETPALRTQRIELVSGAHTDGVPVATGGLSGTEIAKSASSRLAIGLVLSPDFSTVENVSNFYDPGYKFGLKIEYNLTSNLSITSGMLQSMVRYSARGRQYNPPVDWSGGNIPNEMIGECLLLDIPVSLKYNFLNFDNSRFFATAGASSYIMLNEEYQFNYYGNDENSIQNWSDRTGTRHWLSNVSLSVGYELDVHSNWSLRAEPFLNIPVKEVGWGNVRLYSMGSFVSVNFKL